MPRARPSASLVTAVLVLGLALGSVGTATAGGLTTKAVQKIAAKVVKKKAKKLSVGHARTATTATSATQLGGLPPSAYQNRAFTVTLSTSTGVTSFYKALPAGIPNGTYQISVYVTATESSSTMPFYCELNAVNGAEKLVDAFGQLYQNFAILSATRVVTVDGPMALFCRTLSGSFTTPIPGNFYAAPQVAFLRMDSATALGETTRPGG
jgi:hypothetical protein